MFFNTYNSLFPPVGPDILAMPTHTSEIYQKKYPFEKTHLEHVRVLKRVSKDENLGEAQMKMTRIA